MKAIKYKFQAVYYLFEDFGFCTEVSDDIDHFQHRNTSSLAQDKKN